MTDLPVGPANVGVNPDLNPRRGRYRTSIGHPKTLQGRVPRFLALPRPLE